MNTNTPAWQPIETAPATRADKCEPVAGEPGPCPFCGEYGCEAAPSNVPKLGGGQKHAVYCNACFCEGPPCGDAASAIEAWNERKAAS